MASSRGSCYIIDSSLTVLDCCCSQCLHCGSMCVPYSHIHFTSTRVSLDTLMSKSPIHLCTVYLCWGYRLFSVCAIAGCRRLEASFFPLFNYSFIVPP